MHPAQEDTAADADVTGQRPEQPAGGDLPHPVLHAQGSSSTTQGQPAGQVSLGCQGHVQSEDQLCNVCQRQGTGQGLC